MPEKAHSNSNVMIAFTWFFNHSEELFGACRTFAPSDLCEMAREVQVLTSLFVLVASDQGQ